MRTEHFHADDIATLLKRKTIATMPELKAALGSDADITVFRKLKSLSYRSSYSHRGRYYTLDALTRFDNRGLWSCRGVWFSTQGSLLATAEAFIVDSEAGYFTDELASGLQVGVKEALLQLHRAGRIARERVAGRYLHLSTDPAVRRRQLAARHVARPREPVRWRAGLIAGAPLSDELKTALVLMFGLLDEKQRRLYAGFESLKYGHGGDRKVADVLGLDVATVARGRRELLSRDVEIDRVRRAGGGRHAVEKKRRRSSRPSTR